MYGNSRNFARRLDEYPVDQPSGTCTRRAVLKSGPESSLPGPRSGNNFISTNPGISRQVQVIMINHSDHLQASEGQGLGLRTARRRIAYSIPLPGLETDLSRDKLSLSWGLI